MNMRSRGVKFIRALFISFERVFLGVGSQSDPDGSHGLSAL